MTAIQLTQELVRINTINPPGDEHACARYLGKYLEDHGFSVALHEFAENRTNVVARLEGSDDELPLCFTGHIDTVPLGAAPWSCDPFAGDMDGDKLFGRGTTDMKAGVAAFVVAAVQISSAKRPKAGLELVITAGEETGCEGAAYLAKKANLLAKTGAIVVGEPTSNYPLVGHKGAYWLYLVSRGITAHGSMPDKGDNAVHKAARAVGKLAEFSWKACRHPMLGEPTLNVGTIQGGMNLNSVPDKAVIGIDIRTVPGQQHSQIREELTELLGDEIELEEIVAVEGIWSDPDGDWVQRVYGIAENILGEKPEPRGATYFTDGPTLAKACGDPPTLIIGPGEAAMAHQTDEYCSVERLEQAVEFYQRIAQDWCKV
ncbi:MAG: M20 family metallopeptidase [Gammaproteobacteria bacterium]|nr:M20 family metallopeptidase [Gammaproteobacteria bacterium]